MVGPAPISVDASAGSLIVYANDSTTTSFTQNLPDGTLLATGGQQSTSLDVLAKADLEGNVTTLYQFPLGEYLPSGSAIYGTDGNFYGTSWQRYDGSGTNTGGYVYQVTPSGVLTKLYTLPAGTFVGEPPNVPFIQGTDGNFYGATTQGGANGYGSIYQLTVGGQFTTLYSFSQGPGGIPSAMIQASDGNLYVASVAARFNGGLLSRITTSGQFIPLHQMGGSSGNCPCFLTQGSDGIIYGTATSGAGGGGAVFALDVGLPPPIPRALNISPSSGPPGTKVQIWGYNMLKAKVSFNGAAATKVANSGPNYVFAYVPRSATTGPITVATPGGTSTTTASFLVNKWVF